MDYNFLFKHLTWLLLVHSNMIMRIDGTGKKKIPLAEEPVSIDQNVSGVDRQEEKDGLGKPMSLNKCGVTPGVKQRFAGGTNASEGAHPWIVAILKDGDFWCAGSIINERWILTSGNCFMKPQKANLNIHVGSIDRTKGHSYKIKKVITHPRFNKDRMLNSDLALLLTTKPIEFTKNILPICLPDNSYDEPLVSEIKVARWGGTNEENNKDIPVILQEVMRKLIQQTKCAKKYREKDYTIYNSQFCTYYVKQDHCHGDSGGPAVGMIKGKAVLLGVVSYGSKCDDDFPGVYTKTSYFLEWISNTMKENDN